MKPPPRICVVGSSMFDQVTRAARLPSPGETLVGSHYHTGFGGKGSNQAVAAARLGAKVCMVARLGNDSIGQLTLQHYRDEGIETQHVTMDPNLPSGVAPIWVEETTGQNSILIVPGANAQLSVQSVEDAAPAIRSAQIVLCQMETPIASSLRCFEIAKSNPSTVTLLNPAPAGVVPPELLRLTDLLVPNEHEASTLSGILVTNEEQAVAAARSLLKRGPRTVLVTLGSQGAVAVTSSGEVIRVTAPQVRAADTTGAGDCFIGSLAFFLGCGFPLRRSMENACLVAAQSVTQIGTQTSYPKRAELEQRLFEESPT